MTIMDIKSKELSVIKDPFNIDALESVRISAHKSLFGGGWRYSATVEFQNGSTKGEQDFEGESLADVAKQVDKFLTAIGYRHKKMYQGYTQKQILSKFAREVRELEK